MKRVFPFLFMFLGACASAPQRYSKPGATQAQFMADRMACMEAAKKPVHGAYVNAYGGSSNSTVMPSRGLYFTCMGSRGYNLDNDGALIVPPEAITPMTN